MDPHRAQAAEGYAPAPWRRGGHGAGGLSWQDGRTYAVRSVDCVVHRSGGEAHTIVAGDDGLGALAFSSGSDTEMIWLPRAAAWWMGPRWLPSGGPKRDLLRLEPFLPAHLSDYYQRMTPDAVAQVRRFNRVVTQRVGALNNDTSHVPARSVPLACSGRSVSRAARCALFAHA